MIRIGKTQAGDSWSTPKFILDMFPNAFDPCPLNERWSNSDYDGLVDDWDLSSGLVYINPPYSNPKPWVLRGIEEITKANFEGRKLTIIFLLKHDSSTEWYRLLHEAGAEILMFNRRLRFSNSKPASFPSVLMVLGGTQ